MSLTIVIADKTGRYDGRDLERRPLGGTETSVIRLARELAKRGHRMVCLTNCDAPVEDHGVRWQPLWSRVEGTVDLYIAAHQTELLGLIPKPRRLALWVLWPARQLRHQKRVLSQWYHRPIPVFVSLHEARTYAWWLPKHEPKIVVPHGLPDDIRGLPPLAEPPAPRAVFASNPQRHLRKLVELWLDKIEPAVPGAKLDVFGVRAQGEGADPWREWAGGILPPNVPEARRASIVIHPSVPRETLMDTVRRSRAMLYLGHRVEAFCLALAEAQAMGTPCVIAPTAVLPERVIDGVTGFVRGDADSFCTAAVSLMTDDALWRSQHEASLRLRQGISWAEVAARFEFALLSDMLPTDWAIGDASVAERQQPLLGMRNFV